MAFFRDIQDKVILGRWRFLRLKDLSGTTKRLGVDSNGILGIVQGGDSGSSVAWADIEDKPTFGEVALKDKVDVADIDATGVANSSSFLRGDGLWTSPNRNFTSLTNVTANRTVQSSDLDRNRLMTFNGTDLVYTIPYPAGSLSQFGVANILNMGDTPVGIAKQSGSIVLVSEEDMTGVKPKSQATLTYLGSETWFLSGKLASSSPTPTILPTAPFGYAMVGGATTGGEGGTTQTVSTLADLRTAVSGDTPRIVYVSGTITGNGADVIYVGSNKTILGVTGTQLDGCGFSIIEGKNNVIIRNLKIKNYLAVNTGILVKTNSHHVWIDHCEFETTLDEGWDYWGKDITVSAMSTNVTVSFCKFSTNILSMLIGDNNVYEGESEMLRTTIAYCWWKDCGERQPSLSYGRAHMFNTYNEGSLGYGGGARMGAILRTDNNYFKDCVLPLTTEVGSSDPGYLSGISTNIFDNCGANTITTAESDWVPPYEYSQWLSPTSNVPAIVQANAGAILDY